MTSKINTKQSVCDNLTIYHNGDTHGSGLCTTRECTVLTRPLVVINYLLPHAGPPLLVGQPSLPAAHVEATGVRRPSFGNAAYRVCWTLVASINPEYNAMVPFFPLNVLMLTRFLESYSAM